MNIVMTRVGKKWFAESESKIIRPNNNSGFTNAYQRLTEAVREDVERRELFGVRLGEDEQDQEMIWIHIHAISEEEYMLMISWVWDEVVDTKETFDIYYEVCDAKVG